MGEKNNNNTALFYADARFTILEGNPGLGSVSYSYVHPVEHSETNPSTAVVYVFVLFTIFVFLKKVENTDSPPPSSLETAPCVIIQCMLTCAILMTSCTITHRRTNPPLGLAEDGSTTLNMSFAYNVPVVVAGVVVTSLE